MVSQIEKSQAFARLHQQTEAFIIPNPWDLGSARLLHALGYQALATTSAGLAFSLGRSDGSVSLEETLAHCAQLSQHMDIPISADFENGFADDPDTVVKNVLALIETGVAGCSIEDFCPHNNTIYSFNLAVERVQAVAEAVSKLDFPFQFTARAENFFRGVNDLDDTLLRLKAFEAAGANVLYAPGLSSLEQLKAVTQALKTPFNVLAPFIRGASVKELSDAGASRISVGGALCFAAANPILTAANEMLAEGTFEWLKDVAPRKAINALLNS